MGGKRRAPLEWGSKKDGISQVLLVEWQGCPDCTRYGDDLVKNGLEQGLGDLMELKVVFAPGSHMLKNPDPNLHKWVACGNKVVGNLTIWLLQCTASFPTWTFNNSLGSRST